MEVEGFLALILHAHLPYVRHPECEGGLEERWLMEAITESYIPLLEVLEGLERDNVPVRVSVCLTPTLGSMLTDGLLQDRYRRHLERHLELAAREQERTRGDPDFAPLAAMYRGRLERARDYWEGARSDLLSRFRGLQDRGRIELLASAATHGYLPLLGLRRETVRAQVAVGVEAYRRSFGRDPSGFWLPECGFNPGDDEVLREFGLRWVVLETHGVLFASRRPRYGPFAPILCPSGLAAFARDVETSKQVWSSLEGYPGDYFYRDFYRDIGYDLGLDYLAPYLPGGRLRCHTGFKYYRVTGPTDQKQPYVPRLAEEKAAEHAANFLFNRSHQVEYLAQVMDRPPAVVAPYDAELFGHWWFEGPRWLDLVLRGIGRGHRLRAVTPSDYMDRFPRNQVAVPSMSSWGYKGYSEVWLEGSNDWIYRHLHLAADRMVRLANAHPAAQGLTRRALTQAARELLLAQASDWAFIMKAGTAADYARGRTVAHLAAFQRLEAALSATPPGAPGDAVALAGLDPAWLEEQESRHNLFPWLDYRVFRSDWRGPVLTRPGAEAEPAPEASVPAGG
ncbi:MAG: DUF1957 domain-containing protein [Acetobacteraceae bacterium]|nr:DUF1957 domain-containing protein [Acetobacteraceae bacterium]